MTRPDQVLFEGEPAVFKYTDLTPETQSHGEQQKQGRLE